MSHSLNRRQFLHYGACSLAAYAVGAMGGIPWYFRRMAEAQTGGVEAVGTLRLAMEEAMMEMVDGVRIYHWAFRDPDGTLRIPGPVIFAVEGDTVRLEITNAFPSNHGAQHAFAIPGIVETDPIPLGQTITLSFQAPAAGTYLYLDPLNHPVNRAMGLHGVLVVMPRRGNIPYTNPPENVQLLFDHLGTKNWRSGKGSDHFPGHPWDPRRQWIWVFGTADPGVHEMVRANQDLPGADFQAAYRASYFTINGRSGYFSSHGPDILIHGNVGQPALVRIANAGMVRHSPHIHGNHVYLLAKNNTFGRTDVTRAPFWEDGNLPQNFQVYNNLHWIDTHSMQPGDRMDWLLPFILPPDVPKDADIDLANAALTLADRQARLHSDDLRGKAGKAWPALEEPYPHVYPMHCHNEPSQTIAGGNYPQGLVTHWEITGDIDMRWAVDVRGANRRQELETVPGLNGVIQVDRAEIRMRFNRILLEGAYSGGRDQVIEIFAGPNFTGPKIGEAVVQNDGTWSFRGRAPAAAVTRMVSLRAPLPATPPSGIPWRAATPHFEGELELYAREAPAVRLDPR